MVTLISPSKTGAALIRYLINGEGHDGSAERNIYVETVGLMPSSNADGYVKQFRQEWSRATTRHKVQCRHIIISPSDKEIPYVRSNAVKLAGIVKEYIQEHYPDRRAVIAIQQDGNGFADENGKVRQILHAHVALSDCDIYQYKGVEKEKTSFRYLSRTFDDYITEHYKIKIDTGRGLPKRRYLSKQLVTENERDEEGKFFSYMDDIKDRINRCIAASYDVDSFYNNLSQYGLSVEHKTKKNGEQYQTYYLHDLSNISDASKDCTGNIKSIAKKNQLPGMRSYRQEGFNIEEIAFRINHKGQEEPEPDATKKTVSQSSAMMDTDTVTEESVNSKPRNQTRATGNSNRLVRHGSRVSGGTKVDIKAARKLLRDTQEVINRISAEQESKHKADKRYSEAIDGMEMSHKKQRDKSL